MKKVLAILIILGLAVALVWALSTTTTPTPNAITTKTENTENLEAQLQQTEDDGGTADFVELQKSAEGL